VKRISSTRTKPRPKTEAKRAVSETVDSMTSAVNTTAPAAGARPVAGQIVLGAACTIHEAQALRAHLLEQATRPGPYEIDGGGVERIDTAGLQLVVAFALDCLERNVHYTWKARSPVLEEAIQVLGVAPLLESPGTSSFIPGGSA
jgi:phospholipid transport system transporter-binding protein